MGTLLRFIPLAKKLEQSGAFGVGGREYVNYAMENRAEWASKGRKIVSDMLMKRQGSTTDLTISEANSKGQDSDCETLSDD